jgi:hypothetical protein
MNWPIQFEGKQVEAVKAVSTTFAKFTAAVSGPKTAPNMAIHMQRVRMSLLSVMVDGDGANLPVEYDAIPRLPPALGKALLTVADTSLGQGGKVISEGDGVDTPILFKLTDPLRMSSSKSGEVVIDELEFQAKTFGALEGALAAATGYDQTLGIIRQCATSPQAPQLPALPEMLVGQISLSDGIAILRHVLPKFSAVE